VVFLRDEKPAEVRRSERLRDRRGNARSGEEERMFRHLCAKQFDEL
jgi:hypothetical protein